MLGIVLSSSTTLAEMNFVIVKGSSNFGSIFENRGCFHAALSIFDLSGRNSTGVFLISVVLLRLFHLFSDLIDDVAFEIFNTERNLLDHEFYGRADTTPDTEGNY